MEEKMNRTKQDTRMFFEGRQALYPLYESWEAAVLARYPQCKINVQKTQITFSNRRVFACVSFMRPKRKAELPRAYFVLTLGLPYPLQSERVAGKTEPYPGRWTTHLVISTPDALDDELFGWVQQAYEWAENK